MAPADVSLPNGTVVSCLQRHEVPIVYREVQSYFSNGLRLSPGDTVFDVGANIGLFSLEVYQRCHRDVHLYAFEPVEAIFDMLRANVERCTAGDQLKIFDFGLSSTSGPVVFAYYPRAPVLSTAYPDEDADKAELEIFRGVESQDWPKIQQVVVDVHDLDNRLDTITSMLWEHGLTEIAVDQPPTLKQSNIYSVFAMRPA